MASPDYVMVPREPTSQMLDAARGMRSAGASDAQVYRIMLSAAPPSPRSDDGEIEPDIEEIDKWIAGLPSDPAGAVMDAFQVRKSKRVHVRKMLEAYKRSLSTPHSTAVSAIAQERDVGKMSPGMSGIVSVNDVIDIIDLALVRLEELGSPPGDVLRLELEDAGKFLSLLPTTSPSAISEAPCAEAVKTSPEVGEMVERLRGMDRTDGFRPRRELTDACLEAASLLIALDAERGRMREALIEFVSFANSVWFDEGNCNEEEHEAYWKAKEAITARSALPASDEGTNDG